MCRLEALLETSRYVDYMRKFIVAKFRAGRAPDYGWRELCDEMEKNKQMQTDVANFQREVLHLDEESAANVYVSSVTTVTIRCTASK